MYERSNRLIHTVEQLSDEASYDQLFLPYRDGEALPSEEELKEIVEICRAILFPGFYGKERISRQTLRFHTGVQADKLHTLLTRQIYAALCFSDKRYAQFSEEEISGKAEEMSETFIATLPGLRHYLTTDVEAAFAHDPAAGSPGEEIFWNPAIRAITNYRIAHNLYRLDVPFIPRMITEMAHSETGIDIHPAARIGCFFAIRHGTGRVIGETAVIGDRVTLTGAGMYSLLTIEDEGASI
jgi:serine O-acetyltransferase